MKQHHNAIILEDDMVARMILENYCTNHPDITLQADFDNINDALLYVERNAVDLVFLDIQLKNSDGFDLLPYLQSETKVIVTTADPENKERASFHGINNVLIKPISLESFLWSVKKLEDDSQPSISPSI